jgi:hypothetical protein
MKRKLTLLLLALVAAFTLTLPARADGPVCGTMSNPSFICSALRLRRLTSETWRFPSSLMC